ncbi:uncharacterized protein [Palaemon carinicauda]|uniref:uncharacterized protein n=1 Tax=Palaemon carinicauda TaxID=392227 RepID=UPI0035B59C49
MGKIGTSTLVEIAELKSDASGSGTGSSPKVNGSGTGSSPKCRYKIPHSATPAPHLSSSISLKEFDAWRHKFDGYAMLTGIKSLTPAKQRSVLASVLDEDWTRTLRYGLSFPADADLETILNAMERHLRGQRNVIVDRREFYLRKQQTGESFDDFLCGIREIAAFSDFCSSCMGNRLRDRIVVGTRDEQALKRMLEEKDLNLQKAVDICRASESANENSATIRGMIPDSISKVSRYKRDYKKAPNSLYEKERCFRCGRDRHCDMNVCKARDKKCSQCGKIGHFAAVCRSTGKETSSLLKKSKDSKLKSTGSKLNRDVHRIVSDVYVNSAISQATPKVQIHITHPTGNSSILWTPDSGAEATVMGLNVARSLGIYPYMLEPSKIGKLCSAGYQTLNCVGAFTSHLSLGDRQTKAEITVVKEVKGALLSWFDSIALGILPEDFPAQINSLPVGLSVNPDEEKRLKDYKENEDSTCREVHSPVALPRWPYERDPTEEERAEHAAALKICFAKRAVDFCGYKISSHGYTVDSRKVMAIADFPVPQNITDLRSFMGLVNQLGSFSSVIAREAQPLRDLLKQRNEWCWTAQHDLSFRRVKEALTVPPVLAHFDATLPTMLQTDASRLHGLGFALLQKHGTDWKLTQCGSRFLSDVETRYSVIELEMTAVLWSIKKCHTYLAGLPHFDVVIDHRPLIPILNSFPEHCHNLEVELRPFWNIRDMLAVDDDLIVYGARLLIPKKLRRETLECLHDGHQGIDRTKRRARQTVYWPKIDRDIENIVSSCRSLLPNQRNEPLWQEEDQPSRVFESVSADYFHAMGRTYLVYVDRLSGWPCISSCQGIASAAILIRSLRAIFSDTGVPVLLKTDGGPQFAASALRRFLSRWGVKHRITSPYNPKANGQAEASVKIIKKLIMTTTKNGNLDADEFARGMLELRNTPRADGRSPAQVLFGHPLRSFIPTHRRSFAKEWQRKAEECDVKADYLRSQAKQRYDSTTRPLSHLKMVSYVDVQDQNTKLWNRPGVVVGIGSWRDYLIKMGSGRILWKNRMFLRPHRPFLPIYGSSLDATNTPNKPKDGERSQDNSTAEVIEQPVSPTPAPRRSLRHKKEPDRLQLQFHLLREKKLITGCPPLPPNGNSYVISKVVNVHEAETAENLKRRRDEEEERSSGVRVLAHVIENFLNDPSKLNSVQGDISE